MAKTVTSRAALDRGGLGDEQLVAMLWNMLLQRQLDNRGFQLNRQGKIPFALGSEGHEALQAGAAMAFVRGRDILAPYYRDLGLVLGVGITPLDLLTNMFAREADLSGGRQFPNHYTARDRGVLSISSIIAAHCTHAAGVAYALTYHGEGGRAVLCATGEGATSEGEWHEAVNFAAVHALPIVFLVENNGWAISTPQSAQMAIRDVADKAAGYGIPGLICDGTDPIASYRAMKVAMDRARSGGGPTLVEGKVYRFLSHSTDDDDRTYRDREELARQRADDPVPKFERVLLEAGIIDDAGLAAMKADVLQQANDATDAAEGLPYPSVDDMTTHVYAGAAYEPWLE
ncbi:MAG TPA: thiamine pyrophosphate-dependent dehydrogenase E1 component subunit alpha [Candidatus Lustribacter sp.]|jgi:2-oxoisovalerate dehydrogenase E1 component alpha subunit|nr:thiamine pyrophosphate-dependent dehydrogenase E1 component subunit alpha [Candidatus Lustribacter sp.]